MCLSAPAHPRLLCTILGGMLVVLLVLSTAGTALAASTFTGGADDHPLYIPDDHTPVAIHFSATGLTPGAQYYVKVRLNTTAGTGSTNMRGWTWNAGSKEWVQERDDWTKFPVVTADGSGAIGSSAGWTSFKFGDDTKSGTYYILVSLTPVPYVGGQTLNGTAMPAVTVVDMAGGGFWAHNGVATGVAAAKRAEFDLDGTATVAALQKTEANNCDDDSNGVVDDEDYGPAGPTGDFRMGAPTATVVDTYLSSHTLWAPGQDKSSATADVDIAFGATDEIPPSAPSGLAATPADGSALLSWTAATDNVGVTSYGVYRWTAPQPIGGATNYTSLHQKVATVSSRAAYTDTGLTNGLTYHYEVRANDAATNTGPVSNATNCSPVEPPPPVDMTVIGFIYGAGYRFNMPLVATVTIVKPGASPGLWDDTGYDMTTDFTGLYAITASLLEGPPGYAVAAAADDYDSGQPTAFAVGPGAMMNINIQLQVKPTTFSGVVKNSRTGKPARGVKVACAGLSAKTDGKGKYTLAGLLLKPGAKYAVTFTRRGYFKKTVKPLSFPGSTRTVSTKMRPR